MNCMDTYDDVIRNRASWPSLASTARTDGSLRILQISFCSYVVSHPSDRDAWHVLAELYFEDACYANVVWICQRELSKCCTNVERTMEAASRERSSLMLDPGLSDGGAQPGAMCRDLGSIASCRHYLKTHVRDTQAWMALSGYHAEDEEVLMALWCAGVALVTLSEPLSGDLVESLQSLFRLIDAVAAVPTVWGKACIRPVRVEVSALSGMPFADRARSLSGTLSDLFGVQLSTQPVRGDMALSPPSEDWRTE